MIKSMTGYGRATGYSGKLELTVEVRSVNNRFLDCSVRLPRGWTSLEDGVKNLVQSNISRGKVEVYVTVNTPNADDMVIEVNESVADAFAAALKLLAERYGVPNDTTAASLSRMEGVLTVTRKETDVEKLRTDLELVTGQALEELNSMRAREGERLCLDMLTRLQTVEDLVAQAEERSPKTVAEYRNRLTKRLQEVLENTKFDDARILMEAAIFADKIDVSEETVRLHSHVAQFRTFLESCEPVGRKLDFLIQEFNREANTLGSKGNDINMSRIVVELKSEIEKLREQIQNIE